MRRGLGLILIALVSLALSLPGAVFGDVLDAAAADSATAWRDSVLSWRAAFESDAVLTYMGQAFHGPFEMTLEGEQLTINGVQVPLCISLEDPLKGRELAHVQKLDIRADAAGSFKEFVEVYDSSPLLGDIEVSDDELTVRFVNTLADHPYRCTRVWRPRVPGEPEPPTQEELLVSSLRGTAKALEMGVSICVHESGLITGAMDPDEACGRLSPSNGDE